MRLSDVKKEIISDIEKTIARGRIVNGVHECATFTYKDNTFYVKADVTIRGKRVGSRIYKNGRPYEGGAITGDKYRQCAVGGGDTILQHQLLAVCLLPGAYDKLMNGENIVINHKTIYSANKKQNRVNPFIYVAPACDVRDIEICTAQDNVKHGKFIKEFGLYDISISAFFVDTFRKALEVTDINSLMQIYEAWGISGVHALIV